LQFAQGLSLDGLEDVEGAAQRLVNVKDTSVVVKLAAVVWRREYCYKASVSHELVAIFHDLMRSADQAQLVPPIELSDYILSENEAHTSVVVRPALDIELRVRPKKIAEKSSVWNILRPRLLIDAF